MLFMLRDALQQYDEVEFIGIRELGVAVCVSVIQRKPKEVSENSFAASYSCIRYIYAPHDDGDILLLKLSQRFFSLY